MNNLLKVTCATVLLATLSCLATPTLAAGNDTELQKVDISARKGGEAPRTDVRTVCPGIAVALDESLENAWFREQLSGTVRVQFSIKGDNIAEVNPSGGPRAYYRYIRPAVRALDCSASTGEEQTYVFNIRFVDPLDAASPDHVALQME